MYTQLYVLLIYLLSVDGYPTYQDKIPNGDRVPHPCNSAETWGGVGHFLEGGGGNRNAFGQDFATNNFEWNSCLCRHDSDGDGKTNGEELGDPNCVWTEGDTPQVTTGLSHPGVCEPAADPKCLRLNQEFGNLCDPAVFNCTAASDPGTLQFDLRFPSTSIPTTETNYYCMSASLPSDDAYHLVAYEPLIQNIDVVHHILVFGCVESVSQDLIDNYNEPKSCEMGLQGCNEVIGLWGYGHPGQCMPDHFGFNIGESGISKVIMQIHYNNPLGMTDQTDTSGLRLYYTSDRRTIDAGVLTTGVIPSFTLPPGKPMYTHYGGCGSTCTSSWTHNIYLWSAGFHMHYLGLSAKLDIYRGDNKIKELVLERYNYDSPETTPFGDPVEIQPGDRMILTCNFDTTSKTGYTYYGDATSDEMCFAFLTYYPILDIEDTFCLGYRDMEFCESESIQYGDCTAAEVYWGSAEFEAAAGELSKVCDPDTCTTACQEVIDSINTNPCGDTELLLLLNEFMIASRDPVQTYTAELIAPCINPQAVGDAGGNDNSDTPSAVDSDCPFNENGTINLGYGTFIVLVNLSLFIALKH